MFGSLGICSKPNSEHVPGNSEHLDVLREVAGPVRSVRKAPRKIVEATILCLCEGRYLTLDDPAVANRAFIPAFRKSYLLLPVIRTHTDLFPGYSGSFRAKVIRCGSRS